MALVRDHADALDGLRGLAALMVVASHGAAAGMHLVPGLDLEGIGKHGVFLFFVLSAFLLTQQALAWPRSNAWLFELATYGSRRVARIAPLYVCVLVAAWLLGGPGLGVPIDTSALWAHLTLSEGRGIYWSIPVEFLYYLWIPPLAFWMGVSLPGWLRAVGVLVLLACCVWTFPSGSAPSNSDQLRWYLPVLLSGSIAAWLAPLCPREAKVRLAELLLPGVLLLTVPALWSVSADHWHRSFLLWGLCWGVVVVLVARDLLPWTAALLARPWMVCLGRWCFGLYLLHLPAQALARRLPVAGEIQAWVGLLLAIALAALAYRFVERPAMACVGALMARGMPRQSA